MKKVLIADDEPHIARILARALERAGYEVTTAVNGLDALTRIRGGAPDLLISDIEMPKMNGRELIDTVYAEQIAPAMPIFIMTSRTNLEYRQWASGFPGVTFLEKPISARQLVRTLEEFFRAEARA